MAGYRSAHAVLVFITPLLGSILDHEKRVGKFRRSADNEITMLPGWWNKALDFGAKSLGKYQNLIRQVRFDPILKAEVHPYCREDGDQIYTHEAVTTYGVVSMRIPADIRFDELQEILQEGGRFVGLAPQQWAEGYGRFRVINLQED